MTMSLLCSSSWFSASEPCPPPGQMAACQVGSRLSRWGVGFWCQILCTGGKDILLAQERVSCRLCLFRFYCRAHATRRGQTSPSSTLSFASFPPKVREEVLAA